VLGRLDLRDVPGDVRPHLPRPEVAGEGPVEAVRGIVESVRSGGDAVLRDLTARFDGVALDELRVPAAEVASASERIEPEVGAALSAAAARIRSFHESQLRSPTTWSEDGVTVSSNWSPVDRAGCYVPGGRAAYPSTVLMTAVPARVAGVREVVVCVPPDRSIGRVADVTLAAAAVAGVDEVYAIGGAQAIAALAYGTESIAPVDVVCGPGNRYVAIAKQQVAGDVGVAAAFAGPSEIVVVADATAPTDFVAIDLMVQAEHGPDGLAWLITWEPDVPDAIDAELARLVAAAPRREEIEATLASAGRSVLCRDRAQAMAVANAIAPEHLQLVCADERELVSMVRNAGAVFLGPWAPASLGDYAAGPSHVLPTNGSARFSSALTVDDFTRHHHVVEVAPDGFARLAPTVQALAEAEGLDAHAESIRLRCRT
jgi:histidinol dehydrogenase